MQAGRRADTVGVHSFPDRPFGDTKLARDRRDRTRRLDYYLCGFPRRLGCYAPHFRVDLILFRPTPFWLVPRSRGIGVPHGSASTAEPYEPIITSYPSSPTRTTQPATVQSSPTQPRRRPEYLLACYAPIRRHRSRRIAESMALLKHPDHWAAVRRARARRISRNVVQPVSDRSRPKPPVQEPATTLQSEFHVSRPIDVELVAESDG